MSEKPSYRFNIIHENTGFLLWNLSHIWQLTQKKMLEERFGISQTHYVVLSSLHWLTLHDVEVNQAYLSFHTKIDKMTLSKILTALQEKELVERQAHSVDSRANSLQVTPMGEKLLKEAIPVVEDMDDSFFKVLSDEQLHQLNSIFLTLIRANRDCFFDLMLKIRHKPERDLFL